jgi:hypothetical protein
MFLRLTAITLGLPSQVQWSEPHPRSDSLCRQTALPSALEARDAQVSRRIMALSEYQESAFMMILERLGGHDRDRQDFRLTALRKLMDLMKAYGEQFIKNDKDRYHPLHVHLLLLEN